MEFWKSPIQDNELMSIYRGHPIKDDETFRFGIGAAIGISLLLVLVGVALYLNFGTISVLTSNQRWLALLLIASTFVCILTALFIRYRGNRLMVLLCCIVLFLIVACIVLIFFVIFRNFDDGTNEGAFWGSFIAGIAILFINSILLYESWPWLGNGKIIPIKSTIIVRIILRTIILFGLLLTMTTFQSIVNLGKSQSIYYWFDVVFISLIINYCTSNISFLKLDGKLESSLQTIVSSATHLSTAISDRSVTDTDRAIAAIEFVRDLDSCIGKQTWWDNLTYGSISFQMFILQYCDAVMNMNTACNQFNNVNNVVGYQLKNKILNSELYRIVYSKDGKSVKKLSDIAIVNQINIKKALLAHPYRYYLDDLLNSLLHQITAEILGIRDVYRDLS